LCHSRRRTDAERIRRAILEKFESANIPGLADETRRRLLHFVIVGGGPTGVEFAAELNGAWAWAVGGACRVRSPSGPDFVTEELVHMYPNLRPDIKITVIQSQDHILNTYDKAVSECTHTAHPGLAALTEASDTEKHFQREGIEVVCGRYVVSVSPGSLLVRHKRQMSSEEEMPFGMCVWSTGASFLFLVSLIEATWKSDWTQAWMRHRWLESWSARSRPFSPPSGITSLLCDCGPDAV
jgi:NADH:ubiquinone reductase (non-electrogenic)